MIKGFAIEMVKVPAGTFTMGSPKSEEGRSNSEGPQHRVTLKSFFMGKRPVSQLQWEEVAKLPKVSIDLKLRPSHLLGEFRAVENISWQEAIEFCARFSRFTGKAYRLPTEAEWEYACRAGSTTAYSFGENINDQFANYHGIYAGRFIAKKEWCDPLLGDIFPPNAFGLQDMHGNVWEWCQDHWHTSYEGAPSDGSAWIGKERRADFRVIRGGAWGYHPWNCRSATRNCRISRGFDPTIGFRIVFSVEV